MPVDKISTRHALILEAQSSLHSFVRQAWHILEPETDFVDGWHIKAICEHLEAVALGQIKNLIINVPPRTCKSTITSVLFPAWVFIHEPHKRFLCASHSYGISLRDSIACRRVIESDWYQNNWGDIFQLSSDQNTQHKFETNKTGFRHATSVGSKVTGAGGDILIGDDLNDTTEVLSDTIRNNTNLWYGAGFSSRLNNRRTGAKIIMMQRSHEMDVTGYILSKDKDKRWVKLILPYEYVPNRKCRTVVLPSTNGKVWEDPRTKAGELLWPEHEGSEELAERKAELGNNYNIAGQLQQLPAPDEGGIIRKTYFRWWTKPKPPKFLQVIQSWDTAIEASDTNAYSACTTWGLFHNENQVPNLILLSLWRGRLEYPELRKMAKRLFEDYRDIGNVEIKADGLHVPDYVLIEAKATGSPLVHDLRRLGINAIKFDPNRYGDKIMRVRLATPILEAGRVWVPAAPPSYISLRGFANELVELCGMFPNAESRDLVDSMTQVILKLKSDGTLSHPDDKRDIIKLERVKSPYGVQRE